MVLSNNNDPLSGSEFHDIVWDNMSMTSMPDEYWFKHKEFLMALTKDLYKLYKDRFNPFEGSDSLLSLYGSVLESVSKGLVKYDPLPVTNNKEYV